MFKILASLVLVVLLGGFACKAPVDSSYRDYYPGPILTSEKIKINDAFVRVEFVLSEEDKEQYPEAYTAFTRGVYEWAQRTPVEFMIFVPIKGSSTVSSIMIDRPGIILLDFVEEIKAPEGTNYLGTFSWSSRRLRLDMGDFYETEVFDSDMAKAVTMHEIGHLFGLTHFYNVGDMSAMPGSFLVLRGAKTMLMSPGLPPDYGSIVISDVELRQAILYINTVLPTKLNQY